MSVAALTNLPTVGADCDATACATRSPTAAGSTTTGGSGVNSLQPSPAPSIASDSNDRFRVPGGSQSSGFADTYAEEVSVCRGTDAVSTQEAKANARVVVDPRDTDLNFFHSAVRFDERLSMGQFTQVNHITVCCNGDGKVELHRWRREGVADDEHVVVKRITASRAFANQGLEANERLVACGSASHAVRRHAEDQLTEIGVYCWLAEQRDMPQYILRMHAAFRSDADVLMVLEHATGGDLLTMVQESHKTVKDHLLRWTWQLLQAVGYLHRHRIGHRDISLENVLMHRSDVKLMDFGQAVRTSTDDGVTYRYFGTVGKPYYRSPESHVPAHREVQVVAPKESGPGETVFVPTTSGEHLCEVRLPSGALPGQRCAAEPWGYAADISDIFSCGVCLFVMAVGAPPWKEAILSDQHFKWVHRQGIAKLLQAWRRPVDSCVTDLMTNMLASDPRIRPSADACLGHTWFTPFLGQPVPVHESSVQIPSAAPFAHVVEHDELVRAARTAAAAGLPNDGVGADLLDPYGSASALASGSEALRNTDHPSGTAGFPDAYQAMTGDFYTKAEACRGAPPQRKLPSMDQAYGDDLFWMSLQAQPDDPFGAANGEELGPLDVCCRSSGAQAMLPPPPPLPLTILRRGDSKAVPRSSSGLPSEPEPRLIGHTMPSPAALRTTSSAPSTPSPSAALPMQRPLEASPWSTGGRAPPRRRPIRATSTGFGAGGSSASLTVIEEGREAALQPRSGTAPAAIGSTRHLPQGMTAAEGFSSSPARRVSTRKPARSMPPGQASIKLEPCSGERQVSRRPAAGAAALWMRR